MESVITSEAQRVSAEVTRLLGECFPFDALVLRLSQWREQPIRLIEDRTRPGIDGYCAPLRDCDVVATRPGLSADRKQTVQLHELAHILSGHIPRCKEDPDTPTYGEFMADPELRKCYVAYRENDSVRDAYREQVTETIAALLQEAIIRYETEIPLIVRRMYGY
jgi:hypothetical protein